MRLIYFMQYKLKFRLREHKKIEKKFSFYYLLFVKNFGFARTKEISLNKIRSET